MKPLVCLVIFFVPFLFSCAEETKKPTGLVSESSRIPWNTPIPGQGGGQFSMLPQNQHRR